MLPDYLYRLFYVLFAMELAAVALFPIMLLFRFLMRNLPKKYMVWAWRLYFFRIVCPIAVSSPFSIVPRWNRMYHRILASLGLTIQTDHGFLTSWRTVFEGSVRTTIPYRICAFVWLAGIIFLMFAMWVRQNRIHKEIKKNAVQLEGRIYQSAVQSPVMTGVVRCRYYLPMQTEVKQLRYLLAHLEVQRKRKSHWWRLAGFLILLLHWFDPIVWCAYALARNDEEMACDDRTVQQLGAKESLKYAQSLLNMAKEEVILPYTISTIFETNLKNRSARMLYFHPVVTRQRVTGIFFLALLFFVWFLLRPLQMAWKNAVWEQTGSADQTESQILERNEEIVGQCTTMSPNGLELVLRLVMTSGECGEDSYQGKFSLELQNSLGDTLARQSLQKIFKAHGMLEETMVFPRDLVFQTGDYNGDGVQEILLGQQIDWSEEQANMVQEALFATEEVPGQKEYIYFVFNIEEQDLTVISDSIYALGTEDQEIAVPVVEEEIADLFAVNVPKGKNYYVWDMDQQRYSLEKMTQELLNQHRVASDGTAEAGISETKTLTDSSGKVQVAVETRSDTTGSLAIQSIQVGPEGSRKQMDKVDGYYCDLTWATQEDGSSDRYAVLTYNGTKAQTFVLYDVEQKKVYYSQEDGNEILANAFQQYNGSSISFAEGGLVLYSLQSQNQDVLTISFAAVADGNITVRGTYQYHMENQGVTDLSFSQTMDQTDVDQANTSQTEE